jgi:AraC-like DNA-binding protein
MLQCPYRGGVRTLYYEGLALELMGSLLHECFSESTRCRKNSAGLSPQEIERVKAVRDVLLADLENPPSLSDLAVGVGMSDTKLKRSFRAVFGKPIFRFYRDHRLEKAREYLENGDMNVSEAAYRIGYLSLGHFSRAFSERFGITPKKYLIERQRKNVVLNAVRPS